MPREVVHWVVAQGALDSLEPGALQWRLNEERAAVLLGAVAHDAPYYYRLGADPFEHVAERLHGRHGEDTFAPLRALAAGIQQLPPAAQNPCWGFLLGMVSHMVTDAVFHPMVFYFTGDYYAPEPHLRKASQARHRALEVYMDSWFLAEQPQWRREAILSLQAQVNARTESLYPLLEQHLHADQPIPGCWQAALRYQGLLQKLFLSGVAGALASAANALSRDRLKPYEALFSYGRTKPEPLFARPLHYKNPVTGEHHSHTLDDLIALATTQCKAYFERFAPLIKGTPESAEPLLSDLHGPSLSFGTLGSRADQGQHYSHEGLPLKDLQIEGS